MRKSKTVVTVISKIGEKPSNAQSAMVVIYGNDLGKKYNLDKTIIIGRSTKCDIQLDQESVSRSHAKITPRHDSAVIIDLGSTNGTYINDEIIQERVLRDGDMIKIGRTIFKFLTGGNIENSYHEEIYRLTTIDGLTQIANKRHFIETLMRELSRARRYGRELTVMFMDIDHFKTVNDSYGHISGDAILKQLAELVRANIRREDFFARYGGEEFAVLLPELGLNKALVTAEKIRQLVEGYPFNFDQHRIPVTVSIGVATLDDKIEDGTELVKLADQKLYDAKKAGRNRVVS